MTTSQPFSVSPRLARRPGSPETLAHPRTRLPACALACPRPLRSSFLRPLRTRALACPLEHTEHSRAQDPRAPAHPCPRTRLLARDPCAPAHPCPDTRARDARAPEDGVVHVQVRRGAQQDGEAGAARVRVVAARHGQDPAPRVLHVQPHLQRHRLGRLHLAARVRACHRVLAHTSGFWRDLYGQAACMGPGGTETAVPRGHSRSARRSGEALLLAWSGLTAPACCQHRRSRNTASNTTEWLRTDVQASLAAALSAPPAGSAAISA